jgi:Zn-dependent metalloprotease
MRLARLIYAFALLLMPLQAFAVLPSKSEMIERSRVLFSQDQVLSSWRRANPRVALKYPSYRSFAGIASLQYRAVHVEELGEGRRREWDIYGHGVTIRYSEKDGEWGLLLRLPESIMAPEVQRLMDPLRAERRLKGWLGLEEEIDPEDFELKRKLFSFAEEAAPRPVYWFQVKARALTSGGLSPGPRDVVVDAVTGEKVAILSRRHRADRPSVVVRDGNGDVSRTRIFGDEDDLSDRQSRYRNLCQLISAKPGSRGSPLILNPENCPLAVDDSGARRGADEAAIRAHRNLHHVLDYFLDEHDFWGIDNDRENPKSVTVLVNVGDRYENAYWDNENQLMAFGNGRGGSRRGTTRDFTHALDIAGHEFSHAVISSTANLILWGEAGALNEGFADIFGVLIRRKVEGGDSWDVGAALYEPEDANAGQALRSLSEPGRLNTYVYVAGEAIDTPYPARYSEKLARGVTCDETNDYCEVHANAVIWGHTAFLVHRNLREMARLGLRAADRETGRLFFATLVHRLRENDGLRVGGRELLAVAAEMHGANSPIYRAVRNAVRATELVSSQ